MWLFKTNSWFLALFQTFFPNGEDHRTSVLYIWELLWSINTFLIILFPCYLVLITFDFYFIEHSLDTWQSVYLQVLSMKLRTEDRKFIVSHSFSVKNGASVFRAPVRSWAECHTCGVGNTLCFGYPWLLFSGVVNGQRPLWRSLSSWLSQGCAAPGFENL